MRKIGFPYALLAGAVLVLPGTAVAERLDDDTNASESAVAQPGESDPDDLDWDTSWLEDLGIDLSDLGIDLDDVAADVADGKVTGSLAGSPADSSSPVVEALGASGISEVALRAYVRAEQTMADENPSCGLSWSLLAAIGRVESDHGRFGGAQLREDGSTTEPIRGLPLDGRPGVALIHDTDNGAFDGDPAYDRAVGPMQFIPSTWRSVAVDGNGDGRQDPNNIFDAALGSAVYLCSGGGDLTDDADLRAAVYRYNRSTEYVNLVLSLAKAYEEGRGGDLPDPGPVGPVSADPAPVTVAEPVEGPASVGVPSGLTERPGSTGGSNGSGGSSGAAQGGRGRASSNGGSSAPTGSGGGGTSAGSSNRDSSNSEQASPPPAPTTTTTAPTTSTTSTTTSTTSTTSTTTTSTTTTVPPDDPEDPVDPEDPDGGTEEDDLDCAVLLEEATEASADGSLDELREQDGEYDELLDECCALFADGEIPGAEEADETGESLAAKLEDEPVCTDPDDEDSDD